MMFRKIVFGLAATLGLAFLSVAPLPAQTAHPIDSVLVDGADVDKAALRSFVRTRSAVVMATASEIRASDLSGQQIIFLKSNGRIYALDTSDTTTADDGSTLIRDANGLAFALLTIDGVDGADGTDAGFRFRFDSSTSMADPGTGDFRLNNATIASVTSISISALSNDDTNPDVSNFIAAWDDGGTSSDRGYLLLKNTTTIGEFALYRVTGSVTDNSTWLQFSVTHVASSGVPAASEGFSAQFFPAGAQGATGSAGPTGDTGPTGPTGPTGEAPALTWNYSTTTADADPGSGIFRLNHATPASATAAYIDNNERGGTSVTAWLDTLDDSGDATTRGYLFLLDPATPATFYFYRVSGSVVDGTGYRKLTLAYLAGAGTLTNGNKTVLNFIPRGPAGAGDLSSTNNLSDVANPATAFANIKQAATDSATGVVELATTAEVETGTDTTRAVTAAGVKAAIVGKQTVNLLAAGMVKRTTNGCTAYSTEKATNDVMVSGYECSAGTDQAIQIAFPMPKSWDSSVALNLVFYWTTSGTAGTGNVVWTARARCARDDDAIDAAYGTAGTVTDGFLLDGDQHITSSFNITVGGTCGSAMPMLYVEAGRDADNGSDTYTQTAVLQAAQMTYTTLAVTDD